MAGFFAVRRWTSRPFEVVILGLDGDGVRSDVVMVARFDPRAGRLRLVSIPRDTLVSIPGRKGPDKLTHANAYGGPELAVETISQLLGRPLEYYVEFDFRAFVRAVDLVGGVEVDVQRNMYYRDPYQDLVINLKKGRQTLNGEQALGYIRYRSDAAGDLGRAARQQEVIRALLAKARQAGLRRMAPRLASELLPLVRTNIPAPKALGLVSAAARLRPDRVEGLVLSGKDTWLSGPNGRVYYLTVPEEEIASGVAFLEGAEPTKESQGGGGK